MGLFERKDRPTPTVPPGQGAPSERPVPELLKDLPRGNDRRALPKGSATARFEQPDPDAAFFRFDPEHRPGAVFLGLVGGTPAKDTKTGEPYIDGGKPVAIEDDRHLMMVAGSRSGKGRTTLLPNLLTYRGSIIATDPKGELATETAMRRYRGLGQSIYILDPFNTVTGEAALYRASYNPIAAMRDEYLIEDAALIADALVLTERGNRDPHWDESARAFIEGVVLHVSTWPAYEGKRTLGTVRRLLTRGAEDPSEPTGLSFPALSVDMIMNRHPVVQSAAADFFSKPDRERESVHSTVRRHTKFLDFPGIIEVTGDAAQPGLELDDLEALRRERATVYLCLPARHMDTCARWLRLMINQFLQATERLGPMPRGEPPVLCILDEFASLGHMRRLETAAAQIAGFGVRLWTVLQDLGQLEALYDKNYETFMGNAGVLQFFGNSDQRTLEWLSKRLGRTAVRQDERRPATVNRTLSGDQDALRTTEPSLMNPDEIARYFRRTDKQIRQLVLALDAEYPLILQRAYADKHRLFRDLKHVDGATRSAEAAQ